MISEKKIRIKVWSLEERQSNFIEIPYDQNDSVAQIKSKISDYVQQMCPYECSINIIDAEQMYVMVGKGPQQRGILLNKMDNYAVPRCDTEKDVIVIANFSNSLHKYICRAPNVEFDFMSKAGYGYLDNLTLPYKAYHKQKAKFGGEFVPVEEVEGFFYTGDIYVFFDEPLKEQNFTVKLVGTIKRHPDEGTVPSICPNRIGFGEKAIAEIYKNIAISPVNSRSESNVAPLTELNSEKDNITPIAAPNMTNPRASAALGAICGGGTALVSHLIPSYANLRFRHQSSTCMALEEFAMQVLLGVSIGAFIGLIGGCLYNSYHSNKEQDKGHKH